MALFHLLPVHHGHAPEVGLHDRPVLRTVFHPKLEKDTKSILATLSDVWLADSHVGLFPSGVKPKCLGILSVKVGIVELLLHSIAPTSVCIVAVAKTWPSKRHQRPDLKNSRCYLVPAGEIKLQETLFAHQSSRPHPLCSLGPEARTRGKRQVQLYE